LLNLEANAYHDISRSQFFMGQTEAALQASEKAVEQFSALTLADKSNLDWLEKLSTLRLGLAEIRLARGEQGLTPLLSSLKADIGRLLAADAKQMRWQSNLRGRLLWLRAQVERGEAQSQALAVEMSRYLADMQLRIQAGSRLNNAQNLLMAQVELALGELLAGSDAAKAELHWRSAAERLREDVTRADAPAMAVAALAHLHLNEIEEARRLAEKLEASSYRHPDVLRLRSYLQEAAHSATSHSSGKS
jgi:hypothetical protein